MIIRAKIDVTKISKNHIYVGEKGKYIDITLLENRDGPDQFDNDFMVVQDLGKEARERGEKGPILGNGKFVGQRPQAHTDGAQPTRPATGRYSSPSPKPAGAPPAVDLDEDVPF